MPWKRKSGTSGRFASTAKCGRWESCAPICTEPNGPLSLGHARGVVINTELANMHDGEVILRFDDTDAVVKRLIQKPMP